MSSIVQLLIAATLVGASYVLFILFLRVLIGPWGFALGPGLFLALFLSLALYFSVPTVPPSQRTWAVVFLIIDLLLWAFIPPLVLYFARRRSPKPSKLKQVAYGMGAFYGATALGYAICFVCRLPFNLLYLP